MNPQTVFDFLQQNPEFLLQHPELIPEQQGNVVNFQNVMVQKLRQDKQKIEDRQRSMIDNARANMTIQARVQAGVIRAVEARNLEELIEILASELTLMLDVDVLALCLETPKAANSFDLPGNITLLPIGFIDHVLGTQDSAVQSNIDGEPLVFGGGARLVKSQVLMRLNIGEHIPDGLLAFGSRDPLLFADGQGTELIGFLTDIIERLVRRFLTA